MATQKVLTIVMLITKSIPDLLAYDGAKFEVRTMYAG